MSIRSDLMPGHCALLLFVTMALLSCAEKSLTTAPDNTDTSSTTLPPVITSFAPDSAAYGGEVVIEGEEFGSDTSAIRVYIGTAEPVIRSLTPTKIVVVVPDKAKVGRTTIRVERQGKSAESSDSLMVLASPFVHRYVSLYVAGITLEFQCQVHRPSRPDSLSIKDEAVTYNRFINVDTCFPYFNGALPCRYGCSANNRRGQAAMSCYQDLMSGSSTQGSYIKYSISIDIDTLSRRFRRITYSEEYVFAYTSGRGALQEKAYSVELTDIAYVVGAQGEMIAEVASDALAQENPVCYAKFFDGFIYFDDRVGETRESTRIVSVSPDAVARIVLYKRRT